MNDTVRNPIKQPNIGVGYANFYIHFITEICCFYALKRVTGDSVVLWLSPFLYDFLAFVLQAPFGYFADRFPKIRIDFIGEFLLIIGLIILPLKLFTYLPISLIALGNAFIHINGAESTLKVSGGKMSHSAVFVAGGSFGVVSGKLLGMWNVPVILLIIAALSMIPYFIIVDKSVSDYQKKVPEKDSGFHYHNPSVNPMAVITLATLIVAVRGYMGYAVPTSWNKTTFQLILLYVFMGTGKALGGFLIDSIGIKKTMYISFLGALPFLLVGDRLMVISLIGVMFFSMSMPVTLAVLVSVLKNSYGLSFGFTTIGLFLGTAPIFFFKINSTLINCAVITVLTILCLFMALVILPSEKEDVIHEN